MATHSKVTEDADFEPEFVAKLKELFNERIPFNRELGLQIMYVNALGVKGRIDMRPQLLGQTLHKRLHGGVISAGLDAMGGMAIMAALGARHMDEAPAERILRFGRLGTIDLRIDFLRPATGGHFELSANVSRLGSRIATAQMEFFREDGTLLASGAGSYVIS